jgi:hypothetical protein
MIVNLLVNTPFPLMSVLQVFQPSVRNEDKKGLSEISPQSGIFH